MPRNVTRLIRAATEMKFAAMTTAMRRSNSQKFSFKKKRELKTPVIQPLGERLAQGERGELRVLALGVEQRLALLAEEHLLHLPQEYGMRAVRELVDDAAVERHQRVDEHRRAGGELRPVARLEAPLAGLRAAEAGRELPVVGAQHVRAEQLALRDRAVRRGELVDADQHRGRVGARRADRGRGHAVAMAAVRAGDDADAAGIIAVPVFKRLGLGSVLGYLVAGVAIGPWGLRLVADPKTVLQIAEFGVVLLLFLVG